MSQPAELVTRPGWLVYHRTVIMALLLGGLIADLAVSWAAPGLWAFAVVSAALVAAVAGGDRVREQQRLLGERLRLVEEQLRLLETRQRLP